MGGCGLPGRCNGWAPAIRPPFLQNVTHSASHFVHSGEVHPWCELQEAGHTSGRAEQHHPTAAEGPVQVAGVCDGDGHAGLPYLTQIDPEKVSGCVLTACLRLWKLTVHGPTAGSARFNLAKQRVDCVRASLIQYTRGRGG